MQIVSVPYDENRCDRCGEDHTKDGPMEYVLLRAGAVHVCMHCANEAKALAEAQQCKPKQAPLF